MSILQIPTARVFVPLLSPARDKVAEGGRGSGKSHFFAGLAVEDSLAMPGETGGEGLRMVCIREVQKDLAQSAKLLIEGKLSEHRLGEADGFKVYRDVIRFPGDGLCIFKGMNDYTADSIKSLEGFKRAWWEEAQTATAHSINLLRPTMRAKGSQMWWGLNRRRQSDPIERVFFGADKPTGAVVVKANWRDNPWFPKELEQERLDCLRMQPEQYEHVWEGAHVSIIDGAYFAASLTAAKKEGRVTSLAYDPLLPVKAYWDIGFRDATAIWIAQQQGQRVNVLDYYEASGQALGAHLAWLRANNYGGAMCVLPHDGAKADAATGVRFEDHIRQAGFQCETVENQGKGAAMKRVETARRLFPRIWFDEAKCKGGLDALGWYHERKDAARGIGLGPKHDWASHAADAFGLMCVAYEEPRAGKPLDLSRLKRGAC